MTTSIFAMERISSILFVSLLAVCSALPTGENPVIRKLDLGERYQYVPDADGNIHLVDLWVKVSDLKEAARYAPYVDNEFHLFTRQNPNVSEPIVIYNNDFVESTNFNASRRTIVIVHGWRNNAISDMFTVLVPAFLAVEDVNVIVVDWSAGAETIDYVAAVSNTVESGLAVVSFINWLNSLTGATLDQYHLLGHSLGGHQVGIIGRNLGGVVPYITAMDAALPGWILSSDKFQEDDGNYTEVIHTNAGGLGFLTPLGQVDFYPNGGTGMAGCLLPTCDHSRSWYYMAESVLTSGFTGTECSSYLTAATGLCWGDNLNMGGLVPKPGVTGVYHLNTNADSPFSRG